MRFCFFRANTVCLTGQISIPLLMPEPIDDAMPKEARSRTESYGNDYEPVFSVDFGMDGTWFQRTT